MDRPRSTFVTTAATALAALLVAALVGVPGSPARATSDPDVVTRRIVVPVENTNTTKVACVPDDKSYALRGRLVGPRSEVTGANIPRLNILVHDLATGSWFWHLRDHPRYDYAARLAAAGETTLVLDRLGYGASRLEDGDATCLGAQADMLHQVVQHLRSGQYRYADSAEGTPSTSHVILHGHSVGAAIAQVEAATFDDVDGLVLMSWTDTGASQRAIDEAQRQSTTCAQGDDYVRFAESRKQYRRLLFATAPAGVQRAAVAHRDDNPCGDALSLAQLVSGSTLTARDVEAPVLLLFGGRDALNRDDAVQRQRDAYSSSTSVTAHTVKGAGSALPLERSAPATRTRVLEWLSHRPSW